jgi:ABC-type nitrate/sulfonate/bicarbonate transport system substrate-binding protein
MPQIISRRQLLRDASGAAIVSLSSMRPALAAPAPSPIQIANASGALTQTMTAMMHQSGILESFNLRPNILEVQDGSKILGALVSGSVDVSTMAGFGQVFPAIERGGGLKIIGGALLSPTLAMFTGKPDIKSLKALEGRTVGIGSVGALVHQLTTALLRKYQVDVSKVTFANIGSTSAIFRAVSAGTVDAGVGEASLTGSAAQFHVTAIPHGFMATELPDYTYSGAWASDRAIQTKRDVIVRALAAYAKLYRFVQTPQAKDAYLRAYRSVFTSAPQAEAEAYWNYVQTYKPFAVDLALSPQRINYMQELNVSFKVQKAVLPFNRVADMSLAADALKLLG